jgi:protocadherin-16/23
LISKASSSSQLRQSPNKSKPQNHDHCFRFSSFSGEIVTREPLDRELKASYDLVAEARDQGTPYRSARVAVHVVVTDVNDNAPEIVDPQEDVVSVREEQPAGTEVVRIRAIDRDNGHNATITYSILKGRDSDGYGYGMFSIDPVTGLIRTRVSLDHEEHTIYRLAVAATDSGKPPKQTTRLLRIEVLDLNDQRPTFTSSSLVFRVSLLSSLNLQFLSLSPPRRLPS